MQHVGDETMIPQVGKAGGHLWVPMAPNSGNHLDQATQYARGCLLLFSLADSGSSKSAQDSSWKMGTSPAYDTMDPYKAWHMQRNKPPYVCGEGSVSCLVTPEPGSSIMWAQSSKFCRLTHSLEACKGQDSHGITCQALLASIVLSDKGERLHSPKGRAPSSSQVVERAVF